MEMEQREQEINDLVDMIIWNLSNEGEHGGNDPDSDMSSQGEANSDKSIELLEGEDYNDNPDSDVSSQSQTNSDQSIESLSDVVNQVGGGVAFYSEEE